MEMKEKLGYFLLFLLTVSLLAYLNETMLLLVHGFTQSIFEGNSLGKTILVLGWFIGLSFLSFIFLKTNTSKKFVGFEKKSFKLFIGFAVIGYILSAVQFYAFAFEFKSLGPFATITEENGLMQWEASSLTHTHFSKIAIRFLEKNLGLSLGSTIDTGSAWYDFYSVPWLWAVPLLFFALLAGFFGVVHLFSILEKKNFFDFLTWGSCVLATFIGMLDGGAGSGAATMALWFGLLYASRNYLKIENKVMLLFFPLLVLSVISFSDYLLGMRIGNNIYAAAIVIFFSLTYYFIKSWQNQELKLNALNAFLGLILLISFVATAVEFFDFSFGPMIQKNRLDKLFFENQDDSVLFVYGLPSNAGKETIKEIIKRFGEIKEFSVVGWSAYIKISPKKPFRLSELERTLIKELKPQTYLYVEEGLPKKGIHNYEILWFKEVNPQEFIEENFLGTKVLRLEHNKESNSTKLAVESQLNWRWQMLAILTELREKGFKEKVLLIKN
jgi:hypothetical protein